MKGILILIFQFTTWKESQMLLSTYMLQYKIFFKKQTLIVSKNFQNNFVTIALEIFVFLPEIEK